MEESQALEPKSGTSPVWRAMTLDGKIKRRTALFAIGGAGALAGVVLGWDWLAAAGLAPIILALVPCAAMCALGLCASRLGEKDK